MTEYSTTYITRSVLSNAFVKSTVRSNFNCGYQKSLGDIFVRSSLTDPLRLVDDQAVIIRVRGRHKVNSAKTHAC